MRADWGEALLDPCPYHDGRDLVDTLPPPRHLVPAVVLFRRREGSRHESHPTAPARRPSAAPTRRGSHATARSGESARPAEGRGVESPGRMDPAGDADG